jgi:two-component system, NtrC family, sensor kinase
MPFRKVMAIGWLHQLLHMSQLDTVADTPNQAHRRILDHIVDGFEGRRGILALLDNVFYEDVQIVAATDEQFIGLSVELNRGTLGWVAANRRPLLIHDGRAQADSFAQTEVDVPDGSAMCLPLRVGERLIGALQVVRRQDLDPYTPEDLAHAAVLADLLGVAIENTTLHFEQRRRIAALADMSAQVMEANQRLSEAHVKLLQAEKMASVGQLAAGVAHEINNPIGFVQGNLGTLETSIGQIGELLDLYGELEQIVPAGEGRLAAIKAYKKKCDIAFLREDMIAMVKESREGIVRVKNIVRHLQDFSEEDRMDAWETVDIHGSIEAALTMTLQNVGAGIKVRRNFGVTPAVICLPLQLTQVFFNLLINAAQAMEGKQGTLEIVTRGEPDGLCVEIADTGSGIDPAHLLRIFDPFFTTRPVGAGTGLGLAIVYRIVNKHGGTVEVLSQVGEGTRMLVHLPSQPPVHVAQRKIAGSEAVAAETKIEAFPLN